MVIGQTAPDFTATDQDGHPARLADWRGRWLVLYFYPKDDTPGCTLEGLQFSALAAEFAALDAEVVGVSSDGAAAHCRFRAKHALAQRLLVDADHAVQSAYGAWQLKKNYGKEYMGTVRSTFLVAPDGTLAHAWPAVKAEGHAAGVLEKLRELSTG